MLIAVVVTMLVSSVHADNHYRQDNFFQVIDWRGYDFLSTLTDATTLHGYVAEATSLNLNNSDRAEHNSTFRFSFLPRFRCSPLVILAGTIPEDAGEEERLSILRNFNRVKLSIDGEPVGFPALVERKERQVQSFYNASLQRRISLRVLMALGKRMRVEFGDGTVEEFSLLGSRKALEQALGRCKNHG